MKITFNSFDCQFDVSTEKIAVLSISDLNQFRDDLDLPSRLFLPDYVNSVFNKFVFCIGSDGWNMFTDAYYVLFGKDVVLNNIETPQDFDICHYFSCNPTIIDYILHPEQRNKMFLMESSHRLSDETVLGKIYNALESPKTSGVTSLKKFKNFWLKVNCYSRFATFSSTRRNILNKLSALFPKFYNVIQGHIVNDNTLFSRKFRQDCFICDAYLLDKLDALDRQMDTQEPMYDDDFLCDELPF